VSSSARNNTSRAQAPLIALAQAGETVLGHRRRQVVSNRLREGEELRGSDDTHNVQARIVTPILAAVKTRATLGEIADVLRNIFGEHHPA
jgi:methylmalonyl-CoA mutase N-terminal domain/subunit